MAFNLCTSKLANKRLIKVVESRVSGRIVVTDERVIDRALDGFGTAYVTTTEKMGETAIISGVLNYTACFVNAEKQLDSEKMDIDFSERITLGNDIDALTTISIIKSSKLTKESDKIMMVNAIIETRVYGAIINEEKFLEVNEEEGLFSETKQILVSELAASANTSFVVSGNIDDTNPSGKIVALFPSITINRVMANDNYAVIDGSITIDYVESVDDQIKKYQKVIDFNEEIPALNLSGEHTLDYAIYIKNATYSGDGDGERIVDIAVGVGLWGFSLKPINVITDAFSDKAKMNLTYSSVSSIVKQNTKSFTDRKVINFSQQGIKRMDEILFVGPTSVETQSVVVVDGVVEIEAKTRAMVVYKNYDQEEILMTELSDFVNLSIPVDGADGELVVDALITARVVSHKNKAGKELNLTIDYDGVVNYNATSFEQFVSNIELTETLPETRSSIVVYKPKKSESVFEIAKELCVSPSVLLAQNPLIGEPGGVSQVVIYKSKR